jgi:hypothetical protein
LPRKKERERYYFGQLRRALASLPAGDVTEPEPPDFLITNPNVHLGVELTRFFLPPPHGKRPGQEIQSLRERVVKMAEELYCRAGGPLLYARVMFVDNFELTKDGVRPLAVALANEILSRWVPLSLNEPGLLLGADEASPGIRHIGISGNIDGRDKLWSVSRVFWVLEILPGHIGAIVARKGRIVESARSQCDVLWLVIVHDIFRGAPAVLSDEARRFPYATPFDRIWWLEPHVPRAIAIDKLTVAS